MQRRAVHLLALALAGVLCAVPAAAQVRWDLAAAYPATNFHTEN
ncbi:C4-dicarboxylate ABC transporter substrate-binding protein, partial [Paracidovorax avenae]